MHDSWPSQIECWKLTSFRLNIPRNGLLYIQVFTWDKDTPSTLKNPQMCVKLWKDLQLMEKKYMLTFL